MIAVPFFKMKIREFSTPEHKEECPMLEAGMSYTLEKEVTSAMTAAAIGGESGVDALGTPFLLAYIEDAAVKLMAPHLKEGQGSVGTKIELVHKAPTPVGMKMYITVTLTEFDRKRLEFDAVCRDEVEEIGRGHLQRFIINNDQFLAGVQAKAKKD